MADIRVNATTSNTRSSSDPAREALPPSTKSLVVVLTIPPSTILADHRSTQPAVSAGPSHLAVPHHVSPRRSTRLSTMVKKNTVHEAESSQATVNTASPITPEPTTVNTESQKTLLDSVDSPASTKSINPFRDGRIVLKVNPAEKLNPITTQEETPFPSPSDERSSSAKNGEDVEMVDNDASVPSDDSFWDSPTPSPAPDPEPVKKTVYNTKATSDIPIRIYIGKARPDYVEPRPDWSAESDTKWEKVREYWIEEGKRYMVKYNIREMKSRYYFYQWVVKDEYGCKLNRYVLFQETCDKQGNWSVGCM